MRSYEEKSFLYSEQSVEKSRLSNVSYAEINFIKEVENVGEWFIILATCTILYNMYLVCKIHDAFTETITNSLHPTLPYHVSNRYFSNRKERRVSKVFNNCSMWKF